MTRRGGAGPASPRSGWTSPTHAGRQFATITRYADLAGTQLVATSSYAYTDSGKVSSIVHAGGAAVFADYALSYNEVGFVATVVSAENTANYQYDTAGHLVGVDNSALPDESFRFDPNGNPEGTDYRVEPNNQLLADARWTYQGDREGNRLAQVNRQTGDRLVYR